MGMAWSRIEAHGDHFHCHNPGGNCWHTVKELPAETMYFTVSTLPREEREKFHDDLLTQLSDDVDKLFREAAAKRKDKRLSIMITPKGLFPFWMDKECPSPNDGKERRPLENDSDYDYLKLK